MTSPTICEKSPARPPGGLIGGRLRKLTAAGLTLSLTLLMGWQQAMPEDIASSKPKSTTTAGAAATGSPSLPAPTMQQAAKARAAFAKGTHALRTQNSTRAMQWFDEARRLDPGNAAYQTAYELATQQRVGSLIHASTRAAGLGKQEVAKRELEEAMRVDPGNPYVAEHVSSLTSEQEPAVIAAAPMPQFASGVVALTPANVQSTFHLRANAQEVLRQVFSSYGITAILDDSVSTNQVRFDLTGAPFQEASTAVQLATDTFVVPLDPKHVLVAKDTKENRAKYERLMLETIFLPGLDTREMSNAANLVRNVFGVKQVASRDKGTLTIRAPQNTLRTINATLDQLYLQQPEVILDVRVYQVSNSRNVDLGAAFPQQLSVFNVNSELAGIISSNQSTIAQLISSGLVNPGDEAAIVALLVGLGLVNGTVLNQPFALFGNGLTLSGLSFGSSTVNASLNISNTREIDHIQLRTEDSEKQSFLIGERYPIATQTYSSALQTPTSSTSLAGLLAGTTGTTGSTISPLAMTPTIEYQNIGLTLDARPLVLQSKDVQMQLQVKLSSLSGNTVNGSPIINNRAFTTTIQVPDGGSALIASNISRTESKSLSGIPGLSELPGFGWTASPTTQLTVDKLLIVISPHIVSATHNRIASRMLSLLSQSPSN